MTSLSIGLTSEVKLDHFSVRKETLHAKERKVSVIDDLPHNGEKSQATGSKSETFPESGKARAMMNLIM